MPPFFLVIFQNFQKKFPEFYIKQHLQEKCIFHLVGVEALLEGQITFNTGINRAGGGGGLACALPQFLWPLYLNFLDPPLPVTIIIAIISFSLPGKWGPLNKLFTNQNIN